MITVKQFLDAGFDLDKDDVILNVFGDEWSKTKVSDSALLTPAWSMSLETSAGFIHPEFKIKSLAWRKNKGEQPVADGLMVDVSISSGKEIINKDSKSLAWGKWGDISTGFHIKQWKPNLEALEQQMNDKQDMMTQAESDDIEQLEKSALEMSERDIPSFDDPIFVSPLDACVSNEVDFDNTPQQVESLAKEVEWKNGDTAYVKDCSHDEIKFVGLSGNKAVAVCECITEDRRVILDKFWVSDLLKEKPESPQEKAKREREERIEELRSLVSTGSIHDDFEVKWAIEKLYDAGCFK